MRFSAIIVSGVLAALSVSAQNTTAAVVSGTQAVTPAQSSQASCLAACPATDPKCRDACIVDPTGIPNPAIACINSCVQGNGTAAENAAYETCQRNCRLSSAILVAATPAPGSASKTGSGASATGTGATGSQSSGAVKPGTSSGAGAASTGSATTSGTPAASSSSAANSDNVRVGLTAAGIFGAFAAVLAL